MVTKQRPAPRRPVASPTGRRRWFGVRVLIALAVGAFFAFPVLAAQLDESAIPTAEQAALPAGAEATRSGRECASGGCWLRLTFDDAGLPGTARADLLARDGVCSTVAWFDLRRVCVSAEERGAQVIADLSFERLTDW